jgi:hypothetical protein
MAWFCSAKRWPSLSLVLMNLSTHLLTHVSSLDDRALEVKSLIQSSKHLSDSVRAPRALEGADEPLDQIGVKLFAPAGPDVSRGMTSMTSDEAAGYHGSRLHVRVCMCVHVCICVYVCVYVLGGAGIDGEAGIWKVWKGGYRQE